MEDIRMLLTVNKIKKDFEKYFTQIAKETKTDISICDIYEIKITEKNDIFDIKFIMSELDINLSEFKKCVDLTIEKLKIYVNVISIELE